MTKVGWLMAPVVAIGGLASQASAQEEPFEQATIPLEVLPAPATAASIEGAGNGQKVRLDIPLRAAGSIIVLDGKNAGQTLPLAIVGPVPRDADGHARLPQDASQIAWCEHDRGLKLGTGSSFVCWQDLDNDGRLETQRATFNASFSRPLSIALMATKATPIEPRRYRVAAPAERIAYTLEYRPCGPLSGGQYKRTLDNAPGMFMASCRFTAAPVAGGAGERRWRLDRFLFAIGADDRARMVAQPTPGTLLDRFADAEELVDLGTRERFDRERAALLGQLSTAPFQFADDPRIAQGQVGEGGTILEGALRYGYTGRLTQAFVMRGLTSSRELEAGSPVYGVPMGDPIYGKPSLTWCSPVARGTNWVARCLVTAPNGGTQLVDGQRPGFAITSVGYVTVSNGSRDPLPVEEGAADFGGPMAARQRFMKWTGKTVRVRHEVLRAGEVVNAWDQDYPVNADGSADLAYEAGRIRLSRSGKDGATVLVITPIEAGATILPDCFDDRRCRFRLVE